MASKVWRVDVVGPLEPYRWGFEAVLRDAGYAPLSAANQLRLMKHLSVWLEFRDLASVDLSPIVVQQYLDHRRAEGYTGWLSLRGLKPLLGYLRGLGAVPVSAPTAQSPLDELLQRYRRYLVEERGVAPATVRYCLAEARGFLEPWVDASESRLHELNAAAVTGFVVDQCARRRTGSAKIMIKVLRSLLRFLLLDGSVIVDLSGAVPAVAGWRGSHLPKGVASTTVEALLAACEHPRPARGRPDTGRRADERARPAERRAAARRDRAILLLLARLGLRTAEVARLRLDDLDWRHGEIVIRGKGRRDERLPLPTDVGEAIVDYLRTDRPSVPDRAVFALARAPYSPVTSAVVQAVVRTTARRAGVTQVSAHRLRHTVATQVLNAEAPLAEVGQLLRHRSAVTTAIYAKVDRSRLRELALAWPEVGR
jgi:integrase/recombinase XerD